MTQEHEFKNDNIVLKVEEHSGCQVAFSISVSPPATDAAYKKAVKTISKEVSLPGFRKGRAPAAMVVKHYEKYVHDEWQELVVKTALQESTDLSKIYPIRRVENPKVDSCTREEGAQVSFEFERYPHVPSIDLNGVTLKKEEFLEPSLY